MNGSAFGLPEPHPFAHLFPMEVEFLHHRTGEVVHRMTLNTPDDMVSVPKLGRQVKVRMTDATGGVHEVLPDGTQRVIREGKGGQLGPLN